MMKLNLWLTFLVVFGIPEVHSLANQWFIDVPSRIPALQGSCVVIPCVYTYPKTKKILNRWMGFWKRGDMIVSTNLPKFKLKPEFSKRTRMLGSLGGGNCTMQLRSVRTTDVGPFYFRMEIPQHKSFTFSKNSVTIDVLRSPEPPTISVAVLDKVTASCKVSHSCPTSPPKFYWTHSGKKKTKLRRLNKWMWTTESVLTFIPSSSDFNQPLNCTVKYRGKKTAQSSVILFR